MSEVDPRLREHLAVRATSDEEFVDAAFGARAAATAGCRGTGAGARRSWRRARCPARASCASSSPRPSSSASGSSTTSSRSRAARVCAASGHVTCRRRPEPTSASSRCPGCCRDFARVACSRWGTPSPSRPTSQRSSRPIPASSSAPTSPRRRYPASRPSSPMLGRCPFPDTSFDQVLLVSTLEHIGADNEVYGVEGEPDDAGRSAALRELRRILRPSGSLLVTVPLGEPGDYGWFRQEDVRGWTRLFTGRRILRRGAGGVRAGRGGLALRTDVRSRKASSTARAALQRRPCSASSSVRDGCGGSSRPTAFGARRGAGSARRTGKCAALELLEAVLGHAACAIRPDRSAAGARA